tara:strand:+ start:636 stop:1532 length:897 start_codon:yes stop_codon:yes gene_type:complete
MKKILFLGCNDAQIPYLEIIKEQNLKIIGTDINPNAPGRSYCDIFFNCGYDSIDELIAIGRSEDFSEDDLVFTASAQFAHLSAALFCESFYISYIPSKSVEICLNKEKFYQHFHSLDVPIPETVYIDSEDSLKDEVNDKDNGWYWLKSDFSKNPNYVYRFNTNSIPFEVFNWNKDRYFRDKYILQPEHPGISLRLNIYGDRFNVFDFKTGMLTHQYHAEIKDLGIINSLKKIMQSLKLEGCLIKFDLILEASGYVILDIGLEPPFRMRKEAIRQGLSFEKYYLDHYLKGKINYPESLD